MELSVEQKRALALARARVRARQAAGADRPAHPAFEGSHIPGYDPKTGTVDPTRAARSPGGSFLQGAADTTTFGFGDEIGAGIASATGLAGDKSYSDVLGEMRGIRKSAAEQNPKSYLGGQVAGGVAQGLAGGNALSVMANAPTLLGRVGGGMLTGGGWGALYGAGSGEGLQGRATEALKSGAMGALVGGAFPVVAEGVSRTYRGIVDALMGQRAASQAGTTPEVLRMMGNAMDADGTRGPTGQANIAAAGQDAMLADAGPNARAILDTAIQRGGPGAVTAREAIEARTARSGQALTDALDNTLGTPEGITAARTAIRQGTASSRGSAYDVAYAAPIDYADPRGQLLEKIVKGRVPAKAIEVANQLMRIKDEQSKQILAKVADDGSVVFETLPDVRQIDYITRALNQMAESGEGAGALGGQTTLGSAYQGLSREIRDTLRDLVPEYGTALETAADPIRRSKAVEFGSKLFSQATTRDQVDEFARGLTGPERQAAAQGIRSRLDDMMANVTRTVQDGNTDAREAIKAIKELSSRANRGKVESIIGQQQADALFSEIDRATKSFELRASVAENSKTYARLATDQRVKEMTSPGAVGTLMQGQPLNAVQRIAQVMTGQTPAKMAERQDAVYSQIADLLTRPAGQAQPLFNTIDQLGQTDVATRLMAERIARALSGQHLAYPATVLGAEGLRSR